jgi:hypothetical protein
MTTLTELDIEKQEDLSKKRLKSFTPKYSSLNDRPESNLIDLMNWVQNTFKTELKYSKHLSNVIHNKIVIDGPFVQFCEENEIKIECLYKDSFASWKSENNFESFTFQGVFKISKGNLEFIQSSLFHKGNQNEDEVSYFIVVSDDKFHQYTKLRNDYDSWLIARDRENLEIQVIGGEPIPYERNLSWDDLFMEESLKKEIKGTVEGFLNAESLYKERGIPWKRGVLFFGEPGNGKTSAIRTIISEYNFKPVTVQNSASTNDDTITEAFVYAEQQGPSLLYFEDLDSLLQQNISLSHFLNLMDGVASKQGIFIIATANEPGILKQSITDRPSRFDRKWEFKLPDEKSSLDYLKKWFGTQIKEESLKKVAEKTVKYKFSFSYLKELYITAAYSAISNNRKTPNNKDLSIALKQLVGDKTRAQDGFYTNTSEEIGIR